MTIRFLLDTNVLSEPTRQRPHPNVIAKLQQHFWRNCYFNYSLARTSFWVRKTSQFSETEIFRKVFESDSSLDYSDSTL